MNDEVGKEGGWLRATVVSEEDKLTPPLNRWQHHVKSGVWKSDPTLECSREVSTLCNEVKVELQGVAKEKYPRLAGSYLPMEGVHQRGRPVGFQLKYSSLS